MTLSKRIAKAIKNEILKPKSFVKGEVFEDYVREYLFPEDMYELVHKTHDYKSNNSDYVESSLLPDFKFRCVKTGKEFFVEAKYKSNPEYFKDKIEWCKPYQLKRYQEIDKDAKVFIILGFGGKPKKPEELILFPLSAAKFCGLYDSFMDKYEYEYLGEPIYSKTLWELN